MRRSRTVLRLHIASYPFAALTYALAAQAVMTDRKRHSQVTICSDVLVLLSGLQLKQLLLAPYCIVFQPISIQCMCSVIIV